MIGALIGLIVGAAAAVFVNIDIPQEYSVFGAVVILLLFDAALEALKEMFVKKFSIKAVVSEIVFNVLMTLLLTYIGKIIGLELIFAAIVLIGAGILKKFLLFKRFLLNKCEKKVTIEEEELQKD